MTDHLVTDEARAWVGMEVDVECIPLTFAVLQRFLVGIGQEPIASADDDIEIPPMIYQALCRLPVAVAHLTPDGVPPDRRPPVGEGRGMNGEVELEFRRPLRLGDNLRGRRRLVSLEPKQGRRRALVLATWLTEFCDADGDVVIVETVRQILF